MVEVKSSLPLDGKVDIDEVVSSGRQADKTSDEEDESLNAGQARVSVCHNPGDDQACKITQKSRITHSIET